MPCSKAQTPDMQRGSCHIDCTPSGESPSDENEPAVRSSKSGWGHTHLADATAKAGTGSIDLHINQTIRPQTIHSHVATKEQQGLLARPCV